MAKVCIIGFGCIGSGTYEVLKQNKDIIAKRAGEEIDVKYIVDIRDFSQHEVAPLVTTDFSKVLADDEVTVVAETMGGTTYAYDYTKAALESGKSVITSNKELVALKGDELSKLAESKGVKYFYEAAVGGGIPVIRTVSDSLGANNITEITGILNGTTNYILTKMLTEGTKFEDALSDAQKLGYAEQNPTADVEGFDTGKKISILSSMALGRKVNFEDVYTEGITKVTLEDIEYAEAVDCTIKLIGKFKRSEDGDDVLVAPMLIHNTSPLYGVDDVFNAVLIKGDMLGDSLYYGRGAGKLATASAVVSDIMNAVENASSRYTPAWESADERIIKTHDEYSASFMIRLSAAEGAYAKALAAFDNAKTIEIKDGEFAVITQDITVAELKKAISNLEVISVYAFA